MYTLVGFNHLSGTNKGTGKEYDFVLLYCLVKGGIGVVGDEVCVLNANYSDFTNSGLSIGAKFDCSVREKNGRCSVIRFI